MRTALVLFALAYSSAAGGTQERSIAGGERIAVQTARHGWVSGVFQDLRDDTLVLAKAKASYAVEIPYDSVLAWRIPEGRSVRRALRGALLGGIVGAMAGAGVGFEGATKVSAPREVRRESLRFGLGGVAAGVALGVRPRWRNVTVALARGAPGEQMLLLQDETIEGDDRRAIGLTALSGSATITRSELESVEGVTALDAIRRLRPQFLRARRAEVAREALVLPEVYLDGVRLGELRLLETIELRTVLEIQYYPPAEANMRWGLGHEGGVIHVMLRRA